MVRWLNDAAPSDQVVTVDADGELHKRDIDEVEGPWVRTVNGAGQGRTVLRDDSDHVGIGEATPDFPLHILEQSGTPAGAAGGTITLQHADNGGQSSIVFRSAVNGNSDYGYLNYRDDNPDHPSTRDENGLLEIGIGNDGTGSNQTNSFDDDIALMPTGRLGVKTRYPEADLDLDGTARVRDLPTVNNDTDFAVTADAAGHLRRQSISSIRDNLGNHEMEEPLATKGFAISHEGTDAGLKLLPSNAAMTSGRFQIGNFNNNWINEPITGANNGFVGNDGAFFAPVRTGSESADLRLYVLDNPDDQFSIWGNPCGTGDCGNINGSTPVIKFYAGGDVDVERLAHGGGNDLMVLADASGTLKLGPDPTTLSGASGSADNLGNHTATTNLVLGNNRVTRTGAGGEGFRIDPNGNIDLPNGNAIIWGSIYGTGISGDVDANADGNAQDLRLEARDDILLETNSNNGDLLFKSDDDVAFAADGHFAFSAGNNGDEDFRFYVNSPGNQPAVSLAGGNGQLAFRIRRNREVQVANLAGAGNRIVTAAPDGTLQFMTGSSTGLWNRDAGAGNGPTTYLANDGDNVGIGIANPTEDLHLYRNDNANATTLLLDNRANNGDSELSFRENNRNRGLDLRYDGGDERLYVENEAGVRHLAIERNNGDVGIGVANPDAQLHVARSAANGATNGLAGPARLRVQNLVNNGVAAVELQESTGTPNQNNAMSLRYNGQSDRFELVRGEADNATAANVKLSVERVSGETTVENLAHGLGADQMVVADGGGLLKVQPIAADIWTQNALNTDVYLATGTATFDVGIGTDAPTATLDVGGDLRVRDLAGATAGAATDNLVAVDPATGDLRALPRSDFENYWTRDAGTGALYAKTSADRLGIGESNPSAKLHVDGDAIVATMAPGTVGTHEIVVVDGGGLLRKVPANSFDDFWRREDAGAQDYVELAAASDFVGIGTPSAPTAQLHTTGTVRFEDLANAAADEVVVADQFGNLTTRALPDEYWARDATGNGTNGYTYAAFGSDFLGVGTSSPASRLHVGTGQVTISDLVSNTGDEDADRIVTVDASGELRSLPAGSVSSPWFDDGSDRVVLKNNDALTGIGTQTPTSVLHVEDDVPNTVGAMEMRLQNRAGNGEVNLRFRTGVSTGGFTDEVNSMLLRYTNQYDAMEITNGYGSADPNYSSYFKVRRNNGFVGIGVGTAVPSDRVTIGPGSNGNGNLRLVDGNLEFGQRHRIQWDDADSFIGDNGDLANQDLYISAAEDLIVRGRNRVIVRAQGTNGDFDVEADRNAVIEADAGVLLNARSEDLDLRSGSGAGDEIYFRRGGTVHATIHDDGRFEIIDRGVATWDFENDGTSLLRDDVLAQAALRAQGQARFDVLGGSGTEMVVADNNGILATQPIPTFIDTDDQQLSIAGNVLRLTNSPDVTLPADSDDQALLFSAGVLTIESGAGSVDLNPYLDNTDAQALAYDASTGLLSVSGNGATVDLGTEATIDDQQLTIAGNVLRLTNSPDVTLPADSDDQALLFSAGVLTIESGAGSVDLNPYLDNTDAQALAYDASTGLLGVSGNGATVRPRDRSDHRRPATHDRGQCP